MNKKGFTLIELMICILIIGVLTTIAIPVYTRASEKAKTTEAIETLGTVASAEQRYALENNWYSSDFTDLDVNIVNKLGEVVDDETLKLNNFDVTVSEGVRGLKDTAFVRADRIKDNRTSYVIYRCIENGNVLCLDQDETDRITCADLGFENEADSMDPCGGNPVNDASSCGRNSGFWSTATGTCYTSAEERCAALSGTMDNGICKYTDNDNSISNQILDDGMACYGNAVGTQTVTNSGEVYRPQNGDHASYSGSSCYHSTVNEGGVCYGNGKWGCSESIIQNGGKCIALDQATCVGTHINEGGICTGQNVDKACYYSEINQGGECQANGYQSCFASTINEGGICRDTPNVTYGCKQSLVKSGGVCIGSGYQSCRQLTIEAGGIMVAKSATAGYLNNYAPASGDKPAGCCVDCVNSGYCASSGHKCTHLTAKQIEDYCAM